MKPELVLCIPGPWKDRAELVGRIVALAPLGDYMMVGQLLAHIPAKDHVEIEFCERDERMERAFSAAAQGRISNKTLSEIGDHASVAYLHFPLDISGQAARMKTFSTVLRQAGGFAVKVESAGVAHEWDRWLALLGGTAFDLYCSVVVLIGDENECFSCGMHHFGLRDVEVPAALGLNDAAKLMNRFNLYQIEESPKTASGHTFSVVRDAPWYRIAAREDDRHPDSFHHNPHGLWVLTSTERKV